MFSVFSLLQHDGVHRGEPGDGPLRQLALPAREGEPVAREERMRRHVTVHFKGGYRTFFFLFGGLGLWVVSVFIGEGAQFLLFWVDF